MPGKSSSEKFINPFTYIDAARVLKRERGTGRRKTTESRSLFSLGFAANVAFSVLRFVNQ